MEKIYNSTKLINVSRVKEAVYPVYFTGNMVDYAAVHRKPKKKYRPVLDYLRQLPGVPEKSLFHAHNTIKNKKGKK